MLLADSRLAPRSVITAAYSRRISGSTRPVWVVVVIIFDRLKRRCQPDDFRVPHLYRYIGDAVRQLHVDRRDLAEQLFLNPAPILSACSHQVKEPGGADMDPESEPARAKGEPMARVAAIRRAKRECADQLITNGAKLPSALVRRPSQVKFWKPF